MVAHLRVRFPMKQLHGSSSQSWSTVTLTKHSNHPLVSQFKKCQLSYQW